MDKMVAALIKMAEVGAKAAESLLAFKGAFDWDGEKQ